jgi:hypothetical protein
VRPLAGPLLLSLVAMASAQTAPPDLPFEVALDVVTLPPGRNLGETAGIARNSKGHIFVFNRNRQTELLEFDRTGRFLGEMGKDIYGFYQAHSVKVDKDDNVWAVDDGSNMVIKFSPAGRVLLVLGRKWETVDGPPPQPKTRTDPVAPPQPNFFNRPQDVAWDAAGNIYVADGYNNSRVAKFDKDGNWIKSWGERGTGPGQFNLLHTIAVDGRGNVYVGDRANSRIQVFDGDGTFLRQITNIGQPWAICITPGPNQVLFTSDAGSGKVFKLDLEGNILGSFGSFGKLPRQFGWVHSIDCRTDNELYVAEVLNWRVKRVTLQPVTPPRAAAAR